MSTAPENDLYVGYLPVPRRHRRALRLVVPTVLWGLCALSALIAGAMSPAGDAHWDTSDSTRFVGTIVARPYPAIILEPDDDASESRAPRRTIFLVEPGKLGARAGLDALDRQGARVEGFVLERDGRRVLELLPGKAGVAPLNDGRIDFVVSQPLGEATLVGEIVDYKCYMGAMKPGHGLTHRACATLCVSGGIPPALIVRDEHGHATYYVLRSPDRDRLNDAVLPFIARPVRIRGQIVREADVLYLETSADLISIL